MSKKKKKLIIISAALAVIILLYIWGFTMKVENYSVASPKLKGELKIAFVTDLHNCSYGGKDQSGIMDKIDKAQPDMVLFGGDVLDRAGGTENALTLMKAAVEKYPCVYCSGNHELMRDDNNKFRAEVTALGVTFVKGDYRELEIRGQRVRVYGVYNYEYMGQFDKCAATLDDDYYNILLAHQPEQYEQLLDTGDVKFDLILSGHAHGGQWRIPFILDQGLYAPDQGLFPKHTNGMYEYGDSTQIVSRGLARPLNMIIVPRIFNRPELSIITVVGK